MGITAGRLGFFLLAAILSTSADSAQQTTPPAKSNTDMITLDVVVTPKSGPPIKGLEQKDFTVLDNKSPVALTSFQALDERQAPGEVILVIDDVNTGIEHIATERSEVDKFLRVEGGRLVHPTAFAFLTDSGIQLQDDFSTDGNALSSFFDQHVVGLQTIRRSGGTYTAIERFQLSVKALLQLASHETSRPGRKIIVWFSPGWPLLSGPAIERQMDIKQKQQIFSSVVQISTLLRQSRITLYSIDPSGAGALHFQWQSFVKGLTKPTQADYGDMALQVIATQSGGLVLSSSNDISASLQQCLADTQVYYELSFAPPSDNNRDEYHHIEVQVNQSGAIARTRQGYYSQP